MLLHSQNQRVFMRLSSRKYVLSCPDIEEGKITFSTLSELAILFRDEKIREQSTVK
jgi:hypothetical protein